MSEQELCCRVAVGFALTGFIWLVLRWIGGSSQPYCMVCRTPKDYWDKPCHECMRKAIWEYRTSDAGVHEWKEAQALEEYGRHMEDHHEQTPGSTQ